MLNDAKSDLLGAQYALLQKEFVAGLVLRLQEIEAATEPQALHACLHRLAGAAGAYGYTHLGELARSAMRSYAEQPNAAKAQEALSQLKVAIQALLQDPGCSVNAV